MKSVFQKFVLIIILVLSVSVAHAAEVQKPLTGRDLEDATKMNDIYARHMYSSTCMERQKDLYTPKTLTSAEIATRMAKFKESCDCLTDTILKKFAPNDLINYVADMEGAFPPGVTTRAEIDPLVAEKYIEISAISREIRTRQQCGFKQ